MFTEDDDNQELMDLIQSFRVEASKLLGMLDVSNSTVARLKVLSTEILEYLFTIMWSCLLLFVEQGYSAPVFFK
jgi:hypothetical protein